MATTGASNRPEEEGPLLRDGSSASFAVPPAPSPEQFDAQLQLRRVDFDMMAYFKFAWTFFIQNIWRFLGIQLLVAVIFIAIGIVASVYSLTLLKGVDDADSSSASSIIYHILFDFLPGPLVLDPIHAAAFVAVFNALRSNKLIELRDFFVTFSSPYYYSLLGLIFLRLLLTVTLLMLLVLPGIWFLICVVFAFPLHFEHRHLGAWGAIKGSITVVMHYFCPMFFFLLLLALLQVAGAMVFGLGMLVTLPYALVALCYCYHHLVGINGVPVLVAHRSAGSQTAPSSYGATNNVV